MTFPAAIAAVLPPDDRLRIGVITSVNPLIVDIEGNPTPTGWISQDAPTVGLPVAVLRQDQTWLTLGMTQGSADSVDAAIQVEENTTISAETSTTFIPGTPVCGTAFVCPVSGRVKVTLGSYLQQAQNTNEAQIAWEIREGATVGSGTVISGLGVSTTRAIVAGQAVNTGAEASNAASKVYLVPAGLLTPGATYNIQTMIRTTPAGSMNVFARSLIIEAVR